MFYDILKVLNHLVYSMNSMNHTIEPKTSWLCCTTFKDRSNFSNILYKIDLSDVEKQIIESRYLNILENFQKRSRNHGIVFFVGHFVITVGSFLVPALMSIQNSDKSYFYDSTIFSINLYWATFIVSLMVTLFNGILTLFKIDKKYYFLNTTLERLRSEGWQYFGLSGRYSGMLSGDVIPTHKNQFMYFIHQIEKIKMKQVEEEYYKTDEKSIQHSPNTNQQNQTKSDLYPPSPDKSVSIGIENVPEPVKNAVNWMIKSQKSLNSSEIEKLMNPEPLTNIVIMPSSSDDSKSKKQTDLSNLKDQPKQQDKPHISNIKQPLPEIILSPNPLAENKTNHKVVFHPTLPL